MHRRLLAPIAVAAFALTLTGCSALTSQGAGDGPGSRSVVTGLYPLEYVAARVAGDAFEVANLTSPGGEPHDVELGVAETAAMADAALVVLVDSLQPALDQAAAQSATGEVLDVADVVDLRPSGDEAHGDADESHAGHDDGENDPHFWHDPLLMAELGDAVAQRLAVADPAGAADFEANASALRADLEQLDADFTDGLADCEVDTVVTNHDAFGYLERYGLHLESINGISPDAEPSPAALAALQRLIADEGVTTVFYETLVSPGTARTLAKDAGVETGVLDTVEGLTDETAGEDYVSLMRTNLTALQTANRC